MDSKNEFSIVGKINLSSAQEGAGGETGGSLLVRFNRPTVTDGSRPTVTDASRPTVNRPTVTDGNRLTVTDQRRPQPRHAVAQARWRI